MESNNLEELLEYIDPASLSYQEWVNVGMALKEEGYEVVLVNSNPATIMTDTTIADKVYDDKDIGVIVFNDGESYAEKKLEILKSQEPAPDTSKQGSVGVDSSKMDSANQDSTIAIRSLPRLQVVESQQPKLYYDQKEQTLFIRFKKNGREYRYRVSGSMR